MPNKVGRPSSFKPEFAEQAFRLALLGATDEELAAQFAVHVDTIKEWKKVHPEFSAALKRGKVPADADVAQSLNKRAQGYDVIETQAIKLKDVTYVDGKRSSETERVELVEVTRHVPADTTAAIFWLKNRRRTEWRDVHQVEGQGLGAFIGIKIVTGGDGKEPAIEVSSEAAAPPAGKLNGRREP